MRFVATSFAAIVLGVVIACGNDLEGLTGGGEADGGDAGGALDGPAADAFELDVAPAKIACAAGASCELTVTLVRGAGHTAPVTVTLNGLPLELVAKPSGAIVIDGTQAKITFDAAKTAKPASFAVTVVATAGTVKREKTVDVTITPVPGTRDDSFGTAGKVVTTFGSAPLAYAEAVAVQPDGKIVVAGYALVSAPSSGIALARYLPTGDLDPDFGTLGKTTTVIGTSSGANAIAVQADGKIVVAGYAKSGTKLSFVVARYTTAGVPDATFGDSASGAKTIAVTAGDSDVANAVAVSADGSIFVAGGGGNVGATTPFVVKLSPTGTPIAGFGGQGNGIRALASVQPPSPATGIALAPGGKVVVVALANANGAVYRVGDVDGQDDSSFGAAPGRAFSDKGNVFDVAVEPGGSVVAAGNDSAEIRLVRFTPGGVVDATFGTAGVTGINFGAGVSQARAVVRQGDGKLVVGGYVDNGGDTDSVVARVSADGKLDATFGNAGKVALAWSTANDAIAAIALQPDGKIVVAGSSVEGSPSFCVMRLWP